MKKMIYFIQESIFILNASFYGIACHYMYCIENISKVVTFDNCFLFQMSDISLLRYIAASAGGMLPCQILHGYFGSTLRSMDEVVSSTSSSGAIYVVFAGQV